MTNDDIFIESFDDIANKVCDIAVEKGWWKKILTISGWD